MHLAFEPQCHAIQLHHFSLALPSVPHRMPAEELKVCAREIRQTVIAYSPDALHDVIAAAQSQQTNSDTWHFDLLDSS